MENIANNTSNEVKIEQKEITFKYTNVIISKELEEYIDDNMKEVEYPLLGYATEYSTKDFFEYLEYLKDSKYEDIKKELLEELKELSKHLDTIEDDYFYINQ